MLRESKLFSCYSFYLDHRLTKPVPINLNRCKTQGFNSFPAPLENFPMNSCFKLKTNRFKMKIVTTILDVCGPNIIIRYFSEKIGYYFAESKMKERIRKVSLWTGLMVLVISCDLNTSAQNGIFLFGSIDFGVIGKDYTFEENGAVLKRKWLGTEKDDSDLLFNPEIGLSYHFNRHLGISFNVKLTNLSSVFHDERFMIANNIDGVDFEPNLGKLRADSGNFNPNRNYLTPNFSLKYILNTAKRASGPYLAYGLGINYLLAPELAELSYFHQPSNELLHLSLDYKKLYPSHYFELGYLFFSDNFPDSKPVMHGSMFDVSFRYTLAGVYFSGNYQVSQNGTPIYSDAVSMRGNYFSVVLKIGGAICGRKLDDRSKRKAESKL